MIVALISLALVGLMFIQGYWIRNAFELKQANFVRQVSEASHQVILNLEKMEMAEKYARAIDRVSAEGAFIHSMDSVNQVLLYEMQSINSRRELEIFFNKYFITRELMEDLLIAPEDLSFEKRFEAATLDSMLTWELRQRELDIPFEFAVYNPFKDLILIQKTSRYREKLLDPSVSFHFELFPDDMKINPDYLLLYFPGSRRYLASQVWPLLAVSLALTFVVIISFAYTLVMLFRQKRLSEMKSDLINNMTHEFKTPVSTISLACEALNDSDIQKSEELYRNYINIISEENRRLGQMAERILQSASMEKGDIVLRKEELDIHEVLNEVIRNIGIQVEIKDGTISSDLQAPDSIVMADRMHVTNIVQNLLDNANKYSPVKPHIEIATRNERDGIVIIIRDNGIGISKADQKRIFEKLYRVPEGNVHNFKGFGLGLSYVKLIVEKHGGAIRLESELKKGTQFEIYLPKNNQQPNI